MLNGKTVSFVIPKYPYSKVFSSLGLWFLFFIIFTSLSGVFLLAINQYYYLLTVLLGLLFSIAFTFVFKERVPKLIYGNVDKILLLILLLAILLRVPAWPYLEGGQDQGIYTSISKVYDTNRGVYSTDSIKEGLDDSMKGLYHEVNERVIAIQKYDILKSQDYFPFYPVLPIWMSIFGNLFGEDARVYASTFFSIISIIGVYLLTRELFKSRKIALLSSFLLTISPIHVYFSKIPITEVASIAFVTFALYFLLLYYNKSREGQRFLSLLIISFLLLFTFFFLRISGILYIPFFALIAVLVTIYAKSEMRKDILIYTGSLYMGFLLSLAYYYYVVPYLFIRFYIDYFPLKKLEMVTLFALLLPLLFYCILVRYTGWIKKISEVVNRNFVWVIRGVLVFSILMSIYNFYTMAYSHMYVGTVYDTFWKMSSAGISVVKDMSLTSLIAYITIPSAVVIFIYLFFKRKYTFEEKIALAFLFIFLLFNLVITKYTPHHYYFARYQLSEILPLFLIFLSTIFVKVVYGARPVIQKVLIYGVITFTVIHSLLYVSVFSLGSIGGDKIFFSNVLKTIETDRKGEALLVYYEPKGLPMSFIVTPLKYYYNIPTYVINDTSALYSEPLLSVLDNYESTYLLTSENFNHVLPIGTFEYTHSYFGASSESAQFPLKYEVKGFDVPFCKEIVPALSKYCGGIIPSKYHSGVIDFNLYLLKDGIID